MRKAREQSIRRRLRELAAQVARTQERIETTHRERGDLRDRWREALARVGMLDRAALLRHTDDLTRYHAQDLALDEALQAMMQQLHALQQQVELTQEELRSNIVGQEKLRSLVEQGVDEADQTGKEHGYS